MIKVLIWKDSINKNELTLTEWGYKEWKCFVSGKVCSGYDTCHSLNGRHMPLAYAHTFLVIQCPVITFLFCFVCFILSIFYLFVSFFTFHSTIFLSTFYGFQFSVFSITFFTYTILCSHTYSCVSLTSVCSIQCNDIVYRIVTYGSSATPPSPDYITVRTLVCENSMMFPQKEF